LVSGNSQEKGSWADLIINIRLIHRSSYPRDRTSLNKPGFQDFY